MKKQSSRTAKEPAFTDWYLKNQQRIKDVDSKINARQQPDVTEEAWLRGLAETLSESIGDVLELKGEAENYWLIYLEKKTRKLKKAGKPKTVLDLCKNFDSPERRVFKMLEAFQLTIETRASLTQSGLKFFRNV